MYTEPIFTHVRKQGGQSATPLLLGSPLSLLLLLLPVRRGDPRQDEGGHQQAPPRPLGRQGAGAGRGRRHGAAEHEGRERVIVLERRLRGS